MECSCSYDFDRIAQRRGTSSVKWDYADASFNGTDLLPMWIADMDFEVAPGIIDCLSAKMDQKVFGYGALSADYYDAVISWMKRRHDFDVKKEWICYTPGVVTALNFAVQALTEVGDEVIVPTPVYGPFYRAVCDNDRVLVKSSLENNGGYYTFDFEDLESKITSRTRALILCSPHNPVGRVWKREELERLSALCLEHGIYIISDEIHNDLVFEGPHTVLANISTEIAENCVICTAPSKSFNIAGIQASNIIIANDQMREKFKAVIQKNHAYSPNSFVEAAVIGAYDHSEDWLDHAIDYIKDNVEYFCAELSKRVPKIKALKPEGTYLVWMDCSELGMTPEKLNRFFVDKCKLALNSGRGFGDDGALFQRINLACPRKYVDEALVRIEKNVIPL